MLKKSWRKSEGKETNLKTWAYVHDINLDVKEIRWVVVDWIPWFQIGSEGGHNLTQFEHSNSIKCKDFLYRLCAYYSCEKTPPKGLAT
jgi:hypothetical protein